MQHVDNAIEEAETRYSAFVTKIPHKRRRKPTARAKVADAVRMRREGGRISQIAAELGIGRASVYRAIQGAGLLPAGS